MYTNPQTRRCKPGTFQKRARRVAVIGAGLSGITTAKNLLDEGHEVVVFEREKEYCGIWKKNAQNAGVWDNLHSNSSKMVTMFSDYPMPAHYPDYPSAAQIIEYLKSYAEHFGVDKTIRTEQEVISVSKEADGWRVKTATASESFDAVAVCTGVHQFPRMPDVPGLDTFAGTVTHSHFFKNAEPYAGKRVLIIGSAESGQEIAVAICEVTKKLYVSSRHGVGLLPKYLEGVPMDLFLPRFKYALPKPIVDRMDALSFNVKLGGKDGHAIEPWRIRGGNMTRTYVVKSSLSLLRIYEGKIVPKRGVKEVRPDGVVFDDGTEAEVDAIICSSGFKVFFPFINGGYSLNFEEVYLSSFIPGEEGLAFIGYARPNFGSLFSMSEMQARVLAKRLSGELLFPDVETMRKVAKRDYAKRRRWQRMKHERLLYIHSYPEYMFHMAGVLGCKPGLFRYLFVNPKLFLAMLTNTLPVMFRVEGPNHWAGAKDCLLSFFSDITRRYIYRKYQVAVALIWASILALTIALVLLGVTVYRQLAA
jgi:dimethylaniline monooxygenase (N-oxide forming)